jgi:hypothetical protein
MLVWFPSGWESAIKWGVKEEIEVASLIKIKWIEIKKAYLYIKKHKNEEKSIVLGQGPNKFQYTVELFYVGRNDDDVLQMMNVAPKNEVTMDIMANNVILDKNQKEVFENVLIGRIYDDLNDNKIRIFGVNENRILTNKITKMFENTINFPF